MIDSDGFKVLQEKICTRERNKKLPQSLAVLESPLEGTFSINSIMVSEDFILGILLEIILSLGVYITGIVTSDLIVDI